MELLEGCGGGEDDARTARAERVCADSGVDADRNDAGAAGAATPGGGVLSGDGVRREAERIVFATPPRNAARVVSTMIPSR